MHVFIHVFWKTCVHISSGYYLEGGLLAQREHKRSAMIGHRYHWTVPQSGCPSLCSYWWYMSYNCSIFFPNLTVLNFREVGKRIISKMTVNWHLTSQQLLWKPEDNRKSVLSPPASSLALAQPPVALVARNSLHQNYAMALHLILGLKMLNIIK